MSGRRSAAVGDGHGIVCFSAQDWWYFSHAHSDFQLLRRLAADEPVVFVNSTGLRMPLPGRSSQPLHRVGRKLQSTAKLLRRPEPDLPNLTVLSPVFVPAYGPVGRRLLARTVAIQVRVACRAAGITEPAYVVTLPTAVDVLPHLPPGPVLYNRSDRHSEFGEADGSWVADLEARLLAAADRVLYVSSALMAEEAHRTAGRAVFLDHGVDLDHFVPAAVEPPDVIDLPRPIIGYFGGFDDYLVDFELLEHVAREIPEATLLLIGPATCSMRRFDRHPNVVWLGARPYADIPAYGSTFDVALMPFLDNPWIRYANPIKLKEYLALGLPVVSTDFPEAHRYGALIEITAGPDAFAAGVRRTLSGGGAGTPAARRSSVAGDCWDDRARDLAGHCEAVRSGAKRGAPDAAGWPVAHPAASIWHAGRATG